MKKIIDNSNFDSSSDDSMEEKIHTILLAAMDKLNCIQYLNTQEKIVRTAASVENCLAC